MGKNNNNNSKI